MAKTFLYNTGMLEKQFWTAVRDNDAPGVSALLEQHPTFADLRFRGVAWDPLPENPTTKSWR